MEQVQPSIEEMNIVIAKFDGFTPRFVEYPDKALNRWEIDKGSNWKPMEYDTSWDWLVPVIKKIKGMHLDILKQAFVLDYMKAATRMNGACITFDLEKAHLGVYEFIQWYNQQKQSI